MKIRRVYMERAEGGCRDLREGTRGVFRTLEQEGILRVRLNEHGEHLYSLETPERVWRSLRPKK